MKGLEPLVLSDQGPLLLYAHANGYPPEAYRSFLDLFLDTYQTRAVYLRPFWPGADPDSLHDWRLFRDDYLFDLPSHLRAAGGGETLIGMGHSLGGMTSLMAAIQEPGRFRALILIEPTLFPPWKGFLMRSISRFKLLSYFHPLVRRTLRRRTSFPDKESMFQNYREKAIFAAIPDQVLRDYVTGLALTEENGRISLKYTPQWEARVYETAGSADRYVWKNLGRVGCPVLVLRGELSDTVSEKTLQRIAQRLPRGQAVTLPSVGHLLPLEAPEQVAATVLDFLDQNLSGA